MTGMFTDNQPDFTYLKPYEEKRFTQYFMPYKEAGAVKNATKDMAVNLECHNGKIVWKLYASAELTDVSICLKYRDSVLSEEKISLRPTEFYTGETEKANVNETELCFTVKKDGKELLSYRPKVNTEPTPSAAEEIPAPQELPTTEKLFLAAVHLEQYRHATYSPEAYYLEGLKRDASDLRLNNGYGKYLYQKGRFAESIPYFQRAVEAATWKNPNPYDCEPYYNLGLALKATGERNQAFDAFYKAVWDGNMQDKAYYQLACLAAGGDGKEAGSYEAALEFVECSLDRGIRNIRARTLKTALLRLMGRKDEAIDFAGQTAKIDPLDHGFRYELYKLTGGGQEELREQMRGENHNYIELALCYMEAGLFSEADEVLSLAPADNEPMVYYYRYFCTKDRAHLAKAEQANPRYCFPNRLSDMEVLLTAVKDGGNFAAYYLGNLLYDRGRFEEAMRLWESCKEKVNLPVVYRNLSLACYNKTQEKEKARAYMEQAFSMDLTDARIFYELDSLYKALGVAIDIRLSNMEKQKNLLEQRDDLYTEYITLLNLSGEYEKAYQCIMGHQFHPWEGGEGKIPAQYRNALMHLAKKETDQSRAISLLEKALHYPHNLGEGKLCGVLDNDIYFMLGCLYEENEKKNEAFKLAARGDFLLQDAMYYNDQPPQMMYYAALAVKMLGDSEEAKKRFEAFCDYAKVHMQDDVKIDYFAVSLPDFLIFEADLNRKNKVHCLYMAALGCLGRQQEEEAARYAREGLAIEPCHGGFLDILHKSVIL